MIYYPIFLDLRSKAVLVVGGGVVALRKTKGLVEAGALVTVVSPVVSEQLTSLAAEVRERPYETSDMSGFTLVFACTNVRAINAQVTSDAAYCGIPANIADAPEECSFLVPARFQSDDIQVAVSTGGRDPRHAVAIRNRMEQFFHEMVLGKTPPDVRT